MLIARIGQFFTTVARHAVPVNGIFGREWHPATAIVVYWFESVLLALVAGALCAMMQRKITSTEIDKAGIHPLTVLTFHVGSLMVFGGFFAGVLLILIGNGHIAEPMRWGELGEGVLAMLLVVTAGFILDVWNLDRRSVASVQDRVTACMQRWGLFWLLGFGGTVLMVYTERPAIFFGVFAALKITFESWTRVARALGWKSSAGAA